MCPIFHSFLERFALFPPKAVPAYVSLLFTTMAVDVAEVGASLLDVTPDTFLFFSSKASTSRFSLESFLRAVFTFQLFILLERDLYPLPPPCPLLGFLALAISCGKGRTDALFH